MITRIYINNFRCFVNFEYKIDMTNRAYVFIGNNGTGKSSLLEIFKMFQAIGLGESSLDELIKESDFSFGQTKQVMRFEIDIKIGESSYSYKLTVDWLSKFNGQTVDRPRVKEECFVVDGNTMFSRNEGGILLKKTDREFTLGFDWHRIWFPNFEDNTSSVLKQWLASMILISPNPKSMVISGGASRWLDFDAANTVDWFKKLNSENPEIYGNVKTFLKKTIFPELEAIEFQETVFSFRKDNNVAKIKFDWLSDGQKCFVLGALVYAFAMSTDNPFCFWDEPENYICANEIQNLVSLLKAVYAKGQFFATTHSMETLKVFSENDVIVLKRRNQTEPTMPPVIFSDEANKDDTWIEGIFDALEFSNSIDDGDVDEK